MTKLACRYAMVQFMPFAQTGEFANIGIVLVCPRTGYFGFKMEAKKYARITGFFDEIKGPTYLAAVRAMTGELERVKADLHKYKNTQAHPELVREALTRLVHPREAIMRFGPIRVVMAESEEAALEQMFSYYVGRSFATPEYVELSMAKKLQSLLNGLHLEEPFRQARIGDAEVHATFPLVQQLKNVPAKIIKPFNLAQEEPNSIFDHGDAWLQKVRRLRKRNLLTANILFTVALPHPSATKRFAASQEIIRDLREAAITVMEQSQEGDIVRFARAIDTL